MTSRDIPTHTVDLTGDDDDVSAAAKPGTQAGGQQQTPDQVALATFTYANEGFGKFCEDVSNGASQINTFLARHINANRTAVDALTQSRHTIEEVKKRTTGGISDADQSILQNVAASVLQVMEDVSQHDTKLKEAVRAPVDHQSKGRVQKTFDPRVSRNPHQKVMDMLTEARLAPGASGKYNRKEQHRNAQKYLLQLKAKYPIDTPIGKRVQAFLDQKLPGMAPLSQARKLVPKRAAPAPPFKEIPRASPTWRDIKGAAAQDRDPQRRVSDADRAESETTFRKFTKEIGSKLRFSKSRGQYVTKTDKGFHAWGKADFYKEALSLPYHMDQLEDLHKRGLLTYGMAQQAVDLTGAFKSRFTADQTRYGPTGATQTDLDQRLAIDQSYARLTTRDARGGLPARTLSLPDEIKRKTSTSKNINNMLSVTLLDLLHQSQMGHKPKWAETLKKHFPKNVRSGSKQLDLGKLVRLLDQKVQYLETQRPSALPASPSTNTYLAQHAGIHEYRNSVPGWLTNAEEHDFNDVEDAIRYNHNMHRRIAHPAELRKIQKEGASDAEVHSRPGSSHTNLLNANTAAEKFLRGRMGTVQFDRHYTAMSGGGTFDTIKWFGQARDQALARAKKPAMLQAAEKMTGGHVLPRPGVQPPQVGILEAFQRNLRPPRRATDAPLMPDLDASSLPDSPKSRPTPKKVTRKYKKYEDDTAFSPPKVSPTNESEDDSESPPESPGDAPSRRRRPKRKAAVAAMAKMTDSKTRMQGIDRNLARDEARQDAIDAGEEFDEDEWGDAPLSFTRLHPDLWIQHGENLPILPEDPAFDPKLFSTYIGDMVREFMTDVPFLEKFYPKGRAPPPDEMVQRIRDLSVRGPLTMGKFADMLMQKIAEDPSQTFNSFKGVLNGLINDVEKVYPLFGKTLRKTSERIRFKGEKPTGGVDPSMQETHAQREELEEKAAHPDPGYVSDDEKPIAGLAPAKMTRKRKQKNIRHARRRAQSGPASRAHKTGVPGYLFPLRFEGKEVYNNVMARNTVRGESGEIRPQEHDMEQYIFSKQNRGSRTATGNRISEFFDAEHDATLKRTVKTDADRAAVRAAFAKKYAYPGVEQRAIDHVQKGLDHIPNRKDEDGNARTPDNLATDYPVEPELLPRQTMEAVRYMMSSWGFHPEAPMEDLLHMYGHSQRVSHVGDGNSYFGFGYDPTRHKNQGGEKPENIYVPTTRDGTLHRVWSMLNVRGNEYLKMKQKHWSPFLEHVAVRDEVPPGAWRTGVVTKNRISRAMVDYLHNASIKNTGSAKVPYHPATWDTLHAAMGMGPYREAGTHIPYRDFQRIRDPHKIAGRRSHEEALAPHPLQSYFENAQTNLFGKVVVPFTDVMQFDTLFKYGTEIGQDPDNAPSEWNQLFNPSTMADNKIIKFWRTQLNDDADMNKLMRTEYDNINSSGLLRGTKIHGERWRELADAVDTPYGQSLRDTFHGIRSWWKKNVFGVHPNGISLTTLRQQKENKSTIHQQGTAADPVTVGDGVPIRGATSTVTHPHSGTIPPPQTGYESDPATSAAAIGAEMQAKVAQQGGAVNPAGKHIASGPSQVAMAQRKDAENKKLRDLEIAAKAKRAAAASAQLGQKQYFNTHAGVQMPISNLQSKSLTYFQAEVDTSGTHNQDMPKWQEQKALKFVERIKHGYKGLGDISRFENAKLFPLLAREGHSMLAPATTKDWAKRWIDDLSMWGPEGGKTHGSMPSPDQIKSGLMHVLAHEQRRRKNIKFVKDDVNRISDNWLIALAIGNRGPAQATAKRLEDVVMMGKLNRAHVSNFLKTITPIAATFAPGGGEIDAYRFLGNYVMNKDYDEQYTARTIQSFTHHMAFLQKAVLANNELIQKQAIEQAKAAARPRARGGPLPPMAPGPIAPGVTPVQGGAAAVLPPRRPVAAPARPIGGGRGRPVAAPRPVRAARPAAPILAPVRGRRVRPAPAVGPPVRAHPLHNIVPPRQRRYLMQTSRLSRIEQARRGFDPNYGMVHLVNASSDLLHDDDHVIKDMFEDVNKGVKDLLGKRTGPFRKERGRSRIMSRSAHVVIRKRRMQLEMTIKRGVTSEELNNLHAKLGAHARTGPLAILFLVARGRKKLGALQDIDLRELLLLLESELTKKKQIGLLLFDSHHGGVMHKPHVHSGMFTRNTYRDNTIHHV